MSLKITVGSGKPEPVKANAGLIKRTMEEATEKQTTTIAEIVSSIFAELKNSIEAEADVELELTANLDFSVKDGVQSIHLDVSGESGNARTMRLKFNTRLNPSDKTGKDS